MPAIEESISIPSSCGTLEGILAYGDDSFPSTTVLLLSPHPNLGGSMENNVVKHCARRFAEAGCASLRFDYHGVGNSGIAEVGTSAKQYWAEIERTRRYHVLVEDIRAAWDALRTAVPQAAREVLVGYSLGAAIAPLSASVAPSADVVAIAPPVDRVDISGYDTFSGQKVFVTGGNDFVFNKAKFETLYGPLPAPKNHLSFPGQDHFFRGAEDRIANAVLDALGLSGKVHGPYR